MIVLFILALWHVPAKIRPLIEIFPVNGISYQCNYVSPFYGFSWDPESKPNTLPNSVATLTDLFPFPDFFEQGNTSGCFRNAFSVCSAMIEKILSMRNGLNLHSMYMSGALQPLQTSPMSIGFGLDSDPAMNIGPGILPLNQDSTGQQSLDMQNQCASSHPSSATPGLINVANPEASFQVPVSCESIFTGDISAHMQLAAIHYTRNLSENERSSVDAANAKQLGGQTSSQIGINHLEECMLGKEERPEQMLTNEESFIHHLHGLQTARTFPGADAKEEHQDF
ncbi:hypothetical protein Cni_G23970 [Canna indica]|uniref:Uncharacterized protein n=1 Tax=Canna indica TaxID=4628 RepID=A0AAQ3KUV2_9LILI|nr:hypothetical protein Cni_G23970 [Canna indica]